MNVCRGGSWAGVALAVLLVAAGCGPGPTDEAQLIAIDDGLTPVMTPDQVARIVLAGIRDNEAIVGRALAPRRILRMSVTTSDRVNRIEPGAGNDPQQRQGGQTSIVWVVRAQGTFATRRIRLGAQAPTATTGFYVIADSDGTITDFGFP